MIKSIPLANLTASPRNVRKVQDEAADAELAASIAAHGLLNNLLVTPSKPKGMFAVEAGGRRLKALHKLQFDGTLPVDHKVACLVLDAADEAAATEASLAENFQRLAMNPADECTAFGKLIEQGSDVEGVARRFGLTVRFVEGRLRLANLAPQVFEALGAGEITLDAAKAYAATSDQERQAHVFEQLQNSWSGTHPDSIRRMMVNATVPASDRRFVYVGADAYIAAGGRIERDLFADESEARVLDVALLERLAADKLEAEAERLAKEHGWGFVRPTLDLQVNGWQYDDLKRVQVETEPLSEAENEAIATFEAEIEAQIAVIEDEDADDHARDAAETKIRELNWAINAIADKPLAISPEAKAKAGVFVLIDAHGQPRLDRTVYELVGEEEGESGDGSTGIDEGPGGTTAASASGKGAGSNVGASTTEPKAPKLSQRLVDELAMQRRDILALHVAADPALALDLAVVLMLADEGGYTSDRLGSTLSARPPSDPVLQAAMPETSAAIAEAKAKVEEVLDRSWLEPDSMAERFDAFRRLPQAQRDAWLGHAVARTLEASVFGEGLRGNPFHDHLGKLLGIDVAKWWRPTALNWFDRVSKAQCLAALEEVGGTELSGRHAKSKKPELADACERVFAGSTIVEAGVKARALAWVPEPMRFGADETPPWAVNDEVEVDAAADEVAMAMSDETAVFDASGSEDDGGEDDGGDGDAIPGGTPSASVEAEPITVTFVPDDPELARVAFAFDTSRVEADAAENDPGDHPVDLAA